jgi:hypothetical protein
MHHPKISFLTGTVTILGLTIFSVNPAYSTSFDLKFYSSGQEVGSGGFTYTDNEITCIETSIGGRCGSSGPPIDVIFVSNYIKSFRATILGANISPYTSSWWVDPSRSQSAGTRIFSRYGIMIQNNTWLIGSSISIGLPPTGETFMRLDIDATSNPTWGRGNWSTFDNTLNYLGSGTFIATAVPEPLTTLGSLMAIGFGVAFKRKSRGQRSSD